MKNIKDVLLPKIHSFGIQVDVLLADNKNVKECIIKFDKTISIKANKCDFAVMKKEFESSYIPI